MHVFEDQISLYQSKADILRFAGLALALLQASKLAEENKIAGLI
jgi:hypothetical protein